MTVQQIVLNLLDKYSEHIEMLAQEDHAIFLVDALARLVKNQNEKIEYLERRLENESRCKSALQGNYVRPRKPRVAEISSIKDRSL